MYDSIIVVIVAYFDPIKQFISVGSVNDSFNLSDIKVTFSIVAFFVIYDLKYKIFLSVCRELSGNTETFVYLFDLRGNTKWWDGSIIQIYILILTRIFSKQF
jgi:hypothetical protein